MPYTLSIHNERNIYYFSDSNYEYGEMKKAIIHVIQPDTISSEEITSWTIGFILEKNNIKFYFEYFYIHEPSFSLELYPFKNNSKENLTILKNVIDKLNYYLFK